MPMKPLDALGLAVPMFARRCSAGDAARLRGVGCALPGGPCISGATPEVFVVVPAVPSETPETEGAAAAADGWLPSVWRPKSVPTGPVAVGIPAANDDGRRMRGRHDPPPPLLLAPPSPLAPLETGAAAAPAVIDAHDDEDDDDDTNDDVRSWC